MINLPVADALSRYLDLQSQTMRATAANMANVDTPGYHTVGVDFAKEFSQALDAHGSVAPAALNEVAGLISRPDGNNVSMDREAMSMAQTQLQFRTGVELLKHQFSTMLDAIKSEGR